MNDGAGSHGDDVVLAGKQKRDDGEAGAGGSYDISGNFQVTESSSVRIVFCFTAACCGRCLLIRSKVPFGCGSSCVGVHMIILPSV